MNAKLREFLRDIDIKGKRDLYYPPILDYNPEFAASYMTIDDSEKALESLEAIFMNKRHKLLLLQKSISYNSANYNWFKKFYLALNILIKEEQLIIPSFWEPELKSSDKLYLLPPLTYNKGVKGEKVPDFLSDPVDMYRYLYIKKSVQLEDFRGGYPTWYALSDMTIYESYNPMTNVRIRIDFVKGEFRYFISGASDNWKEICDVPLEMDHVISSLLFRN